MGATSRASPPPIAAEPWCLAETRSTPHSTAERNVTSSLSLEGPGRLAGAGASGLAALLPDGGRWPLPPRAWLGPEAALGERPKPVRIADAGADDLPGWVSWPGAWATPPMPPPASRRVP